ncbi:hypothetical protein CH305_18195 [Rhodococcus sp. 15-649-2-2]|uniref:hypothetical protein n=1 Tax=Rhodococcus sp. 15-649-2-2 TaxID=2023140 RepID=UPI000B9A8BF7|nr:hypothetical protein [Rhodococcus sp. 15-649-2-2]OZE77169.1 hypothetical protein CH305_18195 [Rhodococcus sp. 15-649-2-2]
MSLHFVLKANEQPIGSFVATRTVDHGTTDDAVNGYDVTIDTPDWEWDGHVQHRYGDGAWTLVRRAIDQMEAEVAAATAAHAAVVEAKH